MSLLSLKSFVVSQATPGLFGVAIAPKGAVL